QILADIAGGMMATLPFLETFFNEEVGELAFKYMQRNPRVKPENVVKCFKGIEVLGCSEFGGLLQVAGLHGGGSPQMETIAMMGRYDTKNLKNIAKYLFGIKKNLGRIERQENPVTPRKLLENYGKALKAQQKRTAKK
ncbi:MAG: 4-hydroxyphenylacetate 3-hydroxylase C-terminal domain-containing protein, partial [Promethearchaeota archaeon]